MEEKLLIDLNITLACELVSYDSQDVMGSHEVDALGDLLERRLTSKGDVIAKEEIHGSRHGQYWGLTRDFNFGYDNGDVDHTKNMVHSGEGCRVPGYVWVNRVPGNIHLWAYSHAYLFSSLCQETQDINFSHHGSCVFWHGHCHHFREGALCRHRDRVTSRPVHQVVEQSTTTTTTPSTRRLYGSVGRDLGQASGGIFEYYTKGGAHNVRATVQNPLHVYQFAANSNKIIRKQTPFMYLRYGFSPISVRHTEAREKLSLFLVQLCAVIDAIFSITANHVVVFAPFETPGSTCDHPLIQRDALRCRW